MIPDPTQAPEPGGEVELVPAPGVYEPDSPAIMNEAQFDVEGTIKITDSTIARNFAHHDGAGLMNAGSGAIVLERTTVTKNRTTASGGGIYLAGGNVTIKDSEITENESLGGDGGGLYSAGETSKIGLRGKIEITNTLIARNFAEASGGGIVSDGSGHMVLTDSELLDNVSEDDGGGLFSEGETSLTVLRTDFIGNETNNEGGGAWTGGGRLTTIKDSLFERNKAGVPEIDPLTNAPVLTPNTAGGGGLFTEGGPVTITGSTFTRQQRHGRGRRPLDRQLRLVHLHRQPREEQQGGRRRRRSREQRHARHLRAAHRPGQPRRPSTAAASTTRRAATSRSRTRPSSGTARRTAAASRTCRTRTSSSSARSSSATSRATPGLTEDGDPEEGGRGGGFFSMADGDAKIENTTISGNKAAVGGGGIFHDADGEVRLESDTIWRNSAPMGGGVGVVESDFVPEVPPQPNRAVIARNTIIGGSLDGGSCDWYIDSEGGNLDGGGIRQEPDVPLEIMLPTNTACFLNQPPTSNDTIKDGRDRGGNAKLDAIADNGGATLTHRVLRESLAVDQGVLPCPETDQRGVERPQNGRCDVGAFEYVGDPPDNDFEAPESEYLGGPDPGHARDDGVRVHAAPTTRPPRRTSSSSASSSSSS